MILFYFTIFTQSWHTRHLCWNIISVTVNFYKCSQPRRLFSEWGIFIKQSLIVVAKLQIWDGLTRCDQPLPATLWGPRAGRHGTARAPPDTRAAGAAPRPRRLPLRPSVAPPASRPLPPHRAPAPALPARRASPIDPLMLPLRGTDPTNRATRAMDGRACSFITPLATERTSVHPD